MRSNGLKLTVCTLTACMLILAGVTGAQDAFDSPGRSPGADEERGFTLPSEEREVGFPQPGLISEVKVKEGDVVKTGDVLALQDDAVEKMALGREEYLLKSKVQLLAAEAGHSLAKVKMRRQEELKAKNAGSPTEYDEAKAELIVAKLKIDLAKEETEAKRLEVAKIQAQMKRMQIFSPFDGEVRKVESGVGEVADPQKPSILLVKNDPLKVSTKLPTEVTNAMKLGQPLQVRYVGEKDWREAKITYFDPVADASSGTQLIYLELPNPEGRRAGMEVLVKMPANVAAAAAAGE
jgi:RND family efflux transporter MFP subunit